MMNRLKWRRFEIGRLILLGRGCDLFSSPAATAPESCPSSGTGRCFMPRRMRGPHCAASNSNPVSLANCVSPTSSSQVSSPSSTRPTFRFRADLVGVVGPNGCGKSNVIDAVRWVLGESSAKHLRGETMQDVIFNGSGERKPSNRASVELVFDNSLGKAGGAWANYTEISVKRVLERDGESSYYINNMHVRRRDVADIFLGTGLGGRAYAIIEQGMISRIVEARPEELRTFLEEAAGISKYRERRKETEQRLEDTRENLARVDDILQELAKQLEHLETRPRSPRKYRSAGEPISS